MSEREIIPPQELPDYLKKIHAAGLGEQVADEGQAQQAQVVYTPKQAPKKPKQPPKKREKVIFRSKP